MVKNLETKLQFLGAFPEDSQFIPIKAIARAIGAKGRTWVASDLEAIGYEPDVDITYSIKALREVSKDVDIINIKEATEDLPVAKRSQKRNAILDAARQNPNIRPYITKIKRWDQIIETGLTTEWFDNYVLNNN